MDVLYFNSRFVFGKGREIGPSWISGKLSRRIVARQNSKQIQIDGVVEKWCLMFVQMPPKFRFWGFWRFIYKGQKQTMKNVLFLLTFETYLNSAFRRELPNFPAIDGYHGVEFWRFSCRLKKSKCVVTYHLTSQKLKSPCLSLKQRSRLAQQCWVSCSDRAYNFRAKLKNYIWTNLL